MVKLQKANTFFVNLLRKAKAEYFQKLNVKDLSDNKKFSKTLKPYFINKGLNSNKLTLKEKNGVISEKELATLMNIFFVNINEGLDIKKDNDSSLIYINYQNIKDV